MLWSLWTIYSFIYRNVQSKNKHTFFVLKYSFSLSFKTTMPVTNIQIFLNGAS